MSSESNSPGQVVRRPANALLQLAKHSSVYAIGSLLSRMASFLLLPFYTIYLTPFDYGVLDIVETTSGMIGLVAGFGMAAALGRFYYESEKIEDRNRVVSTAFVLATLSALAVLAVAIPISKPLVLLLFGPSVLPSTLMLAFLAIAVGLVVDLGNIYLRLINGSIIYVGLSLANLVVGVGLNIYFLAVLKLGVMGILISNLVTKAVLGLPLVIWIGKRVGLIFDRVIAKKMYKYGLPLMPSEIASVAIGYSDRYFINGFLSTADAGIYGMAQKLGTALHYLITSPFLTAFITQRFAIGQAPGAAATLATAFKYHMIILIALSTVLSLGSMEILTIMTAPQFHGAASLIPLAALSMIILATKYHFEYGILREKKTHYHMYVNVSSAALHVLLNFFLIRWIGVWGAIVAVCAAYATKSISYYVISQRLYFVPYPIKQFSLLLGLSCLVALGGNLLESPSIKAFCIKGGLAMAALCLPFLIGMLSKDDVRNLVALLKSKLRPA